MWSITKYVHVSHPDVIGNNTFPASFLSPAQTQIVLCMNDTLYLTLLEHLLEHSHFNLNPPNMPKAVKGTPLPLPHPSPQTPANPPRRPRTMRPLNKSHNPENRLRQTRLHRRRPGRSNPRDQGKSVAEFESAARDGKDHVRAKWGGGT